MKKEYTRAYFRVKYLIKMIIMYDGDD